MTLGICHQEYFVAFLFLLFWKILLHIFWWSENMAHEEHVIEKRSRQNFEGCEFEFGYRRQVLLGGQRTSQFWQREASIAKKCEYSCHCNCQETVLNRDLQNWSPTWLFEELPDVFPRLSFSDPLVFLAVTKHQNQHLKLHLPHNEYCQLSTYGVLNELPVGNSTGGGANFSRDMSEAFVSLSLADDLSKTGLLLYSHPCKTSNHNLLPPDCLLSSSLL